jgi:hypothetical protein
MFLFTKTKSAALQPSTYFTALQTLFPFSSFDSFVYRKPMNIPRNSRSSIPDMASDVAPRYCTPTRWSRASL